MARQQFAGAAPLVHLNAGISNSDLSFGVSETATAYPDGSVGKFVVILDRGNPSEEKIRVTTRSSGNFTITTGDRGYDGTTPSDHSTGATVEHCLDSLVLNEANAHVNDTTRDDHTQYAKTDGSRAITGTATFNGTAINGSAGARLTFTTHKFGAGAGGGAGTYADIGDQGDITAAYFIASGTPTNVTAVVRAKGTGGVSLQDAAGNSVLSVQTPMSAISSGTTGIGILAYHNGSAVVQQPVTVGAADSGGTGYRVLRVPN